MNQMNTTTSWGYVFLSMLGGLVLMIMPIYPALFYFWPDWIVLITLFFSIRAPRKMNPIIAFIIGIVVDILLVRKMGVYGLGLACIVFSISHIRQQLFLLSILQQSFLILLFIFLFKLITGWLYSLTSDFIFSAEYWYTLVGNVLAWPFVSIVLNRFLSYSRRNRLV